MRNEPNLAATSSKSVLCEALDDAGQGAASGLAGDPQEALEVEAAIRADEYEFSSRLPQSPTRATESKARVVRTASAKPSKTPKAPTIDMD